MVDHNNFSELEVCIKISGIPVALISPEESCNITSKTFPSPLEFDHCFNCDFFITLALIRNLFC